MNVKWQHATGYLMIVLAACFWGGSASFGKTLMQSGISTIRLMEIRSILTSFVLLVFLGTFGRKHLQIEFSEIPRFLLLAIPGLALVNASYYKAVQLLPVAIAAFIQFTAPVLIFVYGFLMRTEKATLGKFAALLLSLSGAYLMLQLNSGVSTKLPAFGVICAFVSMLSYVFYLLMSHSLSRKHSPWTLVVYGYAIASIFWCLVTNPVDTAAELTRHGLWPAAALFALCSTLIPFMLFLSGLRRVSATGAAIASTSETVTAALFAYFFLGETLRAGQILGAFFILVAVTLLILQPHALPEAAITGDHPA